VLGDMTYACAYWPASLNVSVGAEGYDDSKQLTAEKRDELFKRIHGHTDIGYVLRVISAEEISNSMLQVGR
jgi:ribonuclease H2 subunit A